MESYPRVLVATDGSPQATAAVRIGSRIAARGGIPLNLLSVSGDGEACEATDALTAAEATAKELGVAEVDSEHAHGNAPEILLARANADPNALVVVGSQGLSKKTERLVGSSSNKLTHHSDADVLFAKDPAPTTWNFVALATDGSPTSHHAVRRGLTLAAALGARPRLITAAKSEDAGAEVLEATWTALGLGEGDVEVEREVLVDPQPAAAIVNAGWKYELVVIGNRGMSGPARLLGSVANKVTHGLKTNLLLVNTTRGAEG